MADEKDVMSDNDRSWCESHEAVLGFARVLHAAGYWATSDPRDVVADVLSYFEKPWKWTPELRKYQAWLRDPANEVHDGWTHPEHLPPDFFDMSETPPESNPEPEDVKPAKVGRGMSKSERERCLHLVRQSRGCSTQYLTNHGIALTLICALVSEGVITRAGEAPLADIIEIV